MSNLNAIGGIRNYLKQFMPTKDMYLYCVAYLDSKQRTVVGGWNNVAQEVQKDFKDFVDYTRERYGKSI